VKARPEMFKREREEKKPEQEVNLAPKSEIYFEPHPPQLWLVKVPNFLMEQWKDCDEGTDLGNLEIRSIAGASPEVSLNLNTMHGVPSQYVVNYLPIKDAETQVFSEDASGEIKIEGTVAYKMDMKARDNDALSQTIIQRATELDKQQKKKKLNLALLM